MSTEISHDGDGLHQIHAPPDGFFRRYVFSTDHKYIGKQYLFTAFFFGLIAGLLALTMRWQLAYPGHPVPVLGPLLAGWNNIFSSDGSVNEGGYNQLVTMHGLLMVFFVIIPTIVGGFGNFLIPLHIGARDVAFPVLNALSYWLYFVAGIGMIAAILVGPPGGGWTVYPTLSGLSTAAPGNDPGLILAAISIFLVGFSSILGGLNFLVTIVTLRAPGMTWGRLPLVTWAQFITAVFQTLATPVVAAALMLLTMELLFKTSFFTPADVYLEKSRVANAGGGNPLLWQHLFWFYAHPAVYILILPTMGIASEILSTFSRKPIFGYIPMVASMVAIMGLGFIVWGHHMFQTGMNPYLGFSFMTSTMLIALPSGVKVFNWLGTLYRGNLRFTTAMLFGLSFLAMFIIGGLSGLFMAATPVDVHIHDTYYIVAHFHYVVFGGTFMGVFGGLYFWFPKLFGRMMNETIGKIHWAITFLALNGVFFPMHFLGEAGHPRRISNPLVYNELHDVQWMNVLITHSALVLGAVQILFLFNFFWSIFRGPKAPENPWEANTLEWTTASPVPYHNFDRVPTVYHGPYEYSSGATNGRGDWLPQNEPAEPVKHA